MNIQRRTSTVTLAGPVARRLAGLTMAGERIYRRERTRVAAPVTWPLLGRAEHRFHLGLQRRGVERLDDVVADAGLLRGDDVLGLRFRGDHDEGRLRQLGARA